MAKTRFNTPVEIFQYRYSFFFKSIDMEVNENPIKPIKKLKNIASDLIDPVT